VPFLIAYAVLAERRPSLVLVSSLVSLVAALGVAAPHLLAFGRLASATGRARVNYGDLATYSLGSFARYMLGFEDPMPRLHTDLAIFYSLPVLALALLGVLCLWTSRHPALAHVVWLGALPFAAVCLVLLVPATREWLTPLRPVDVTRVWWCSNVFLMLAFGHGVAAAVHGRVPRPIAAAMLLASLAVLVVVASRVRMGTADVWLSLASTVLMFALCLRHGRAWTVAMVVLLAASLLPRMDRFVELIHPPGTLVRAADLRFPEAFADRIARNTRLASMSPDLDQKASAHGILGSTGRSIILSAALQDHLAGRGLTVPDRGGLIYFFKPAPPAVLAEYGIRYFAAPLAHDLERWGWKRLGDEAGGYRLYENPAPVQPCRAVDAHGGLVDYLPIAALDTRGFAIDVPAGLIGREIVCAFHAWPGWRATPVPLSPAPQEPSFLRVTPSGAGRVSFEYAPWSNRSIALTSAGSGVGFALWLAAFHRSRRRRAPVSA
jgi:hypothetical protein